MYGRCIWDSTIKWNSFSSFLWSFVIMYHSLCYILKMEATWPTKTLHVVLTNQMKQHHISEVSRSIGESHISHTHELNAFGRRFSVILLYCAYMWPHVQAVHFDILIFSSDFTNMATLLSLTHVHNDLAGAVCWFYVRKLLYIREVVQVKFFSGCSR